MDCFARKTVTNPAQNSRKNAPTQIMKIPMPIGCASVGYNAYAWLSALGWHTAQSGGFGLACHAANASVGFAAHVNDAAAQAILRKPGTVNQQMIFISGLTMLSLLPLVFYFRAVRRRLG